VVIARKGVTGVLAALLIALITVSSLAAVLTLTGRSLEHSREALESAAKRARDIATPPALSLEVRGGSLVATVISQNPTEIRWFIVERPDGSFELKPGGKVQIGARFTLSTNYNCQPVRVYMLLASGAAVAYDPRNDPLIARMIEGWDGWWKCDMNRNTVTTPMNLQTTTHMILQDVVWILQPTQPTELTWRDCMFLWWILQSNPSAIHLPVIPPGCEQYLPPPPIVLYPPVVPPGYEEYPPSPPGLPLPIVQHPPSPPGLVRFDPDLEREPAPTPYPPHVIRIPDLIEPQLPLVDYYYYDYYYYDYGVYYYDYYYYVYYYYYNYYDYN
jgi:hypothetical protein